MIFRWRWGFYHHLDLIWVWVVEAIYGSDEGCVDLIPLRAGTWPWNSLLRMLAHLHDCGLDFHSLTLIRVGNRVATSFWHDVWKGDVPLQTFFLLLQLVL